MTASRGRPRLDQVAELTRGIRLPRPAVADIHLQILAEGLREAFDDLCEREPAKMASGAEPEVTALLQARLNRPANEESLWSQLVLFVVRGGESISFDGSHLEKRPDLSIYLSDRAQHFPLVVEAKILDGASGKTVASYCDRGLLKFVTGEYAWTNREAFMLGYVRDGSSIDANLTPRLAAGPASNPQAYLVERLPVQVGSGGLDLAYTRHGREFTYPTQAPPNSPGSISVWHFWLR